MIGHLLEAGIAFFVGGSDLAIFFFWESDATDGACVNNAAAPGLGGRLDDVSCAVHIGGVHGPVILEPKVIAGGDVKAPVATAHGSGQKFAVGEIAFDEFVLGAVESARVAIFAEQGFDIVAAGFQFMNQICPDEAGSASDETIHKLD